MKKTEMQKAEDYLKKAKEILNNTPVEDEHYTDVKNIKKAGRAAWKGCITTLDYVLSKERPQAFPPMLSGRIKWPFYRPRLTVSLLFP